MALIEIDGLPFLIAMVIFHGELLNNQRVNLTLIFNAWPVARFQNMGLPEPTKNRSDSSIMFHPRLCRIQHPYLKHPAYAFSTILNKVLQTYMVSNLVFPIQQ